MKVVAFTDEPILSLPQLEEILLQRLPEEYRPQFRTPPHPSKLTENEHGVSQLAIDEAVKRIRHAIEQQQQIVIFGDYDCDGVTATAVLWETLHHLGAKVVPFLPHREQHGYGLSVKALEDLWKSTPPDLLITVDNGIVANEAFAWLKQKGVTTILTDHHQPNSELPLANVILHSTRLCGAGISWLLASALDPEFANQELDLVVLGTIADQVPLTGASRAFAWHGLRALRQTQRPSLQMLAKLSGHKLPEATENTIHYGLAPRINAMGRLSHALEALRALLSRQPGRLTQLMQKLQETNQERQHLTDTSVEELDSAMVTSPDEPISIAVGQYPEGIIGLLASKLVDRFHKPAVVITTLSSPHKASCRSVAGVDITALLRSLPSELFTALGGHPAAAGFSVLTANIDSLLTQLRAQAQSKIQPEQLEPALHVLGNLDWQLLNYDTTTLLNTFSPYGNGNEEPLFLLRNFSILDRKTMGRQGDHLKLQLQHLDTHRSYSAICFGYQKRLPHPDSLSELYVRLKPSTYRPGTVDIEVVAGQ